MNAAFPFDLPMPTAFYLSAYVLTMVIHVVFMNYVLAGTVVLAGSYFVKGDRGTGASSSILKEWMPFMLSGAITAGVAPLLFIQILYKREFYTANLLLFNRWMAILPILIVGFYALYLLKTKWLGRRSGVMAALIALVPVVCIAFTGYSWTENHLLSVRDPGYWGEFYGTRAQSYHESQLMPRLLVWATGSIPTLVLALAWQHWYRGTGNARGLARSAGMGLVLVMGSSAWYYLATDDVTRQAFLSPLALPYFAAACVGLMVQLIGWGWVIVRRQLSVGPLVVATVGLLLTVIGMTVCRESVRMATFGTQRLEAMYPIHAEAYGKGGLPLFLAFFIINGGLIVLVFWLVRHRSIGPVDKA